MKNLNAFNNLKIRTKLLTLSVATLFFLAFFGTAVLYHDVAENKKSLQLLESNTRSAYDSQVKSQVQNAITLLNGVYQKHLSGEFTFDQSKKLGADLVRSLRYGKDGYFWVDTTEGVNVVLLGTSTEGTNRYRYKDAKGTFIMKAFIQNAVSGNKVCLDYWYPRQGTTQAVRKRGYCELFKPFGWVVGTGNYVDDIDREIADMSRQQNDALKEKMLLYLALFFGFSCLTFFAAALISKNISDPIRESVDLAIQISNGVMNVEIGEEFKSRRDEVGELSVSLEGMRNSIQTLVRDLTEQADALSREKELLRMTLISVGEGVITVDEEGQITLMNRAAEQLTEWQQQEVIGSSIDDVFRIVQDRGNDDAKIGVIHHIFQNNITAIPENNIALITKSGRRVPIESSAAPISVKNGEVSGAVVVFRDVSEKRRKEEEIQYLGYHDQLTGLYNRTYFEEQMALIDSPKNRPVSLIMADVNGLKLTNDAYGHLAGDRLIQKAAKVMKDLCRTEDLIFRIGGDEFVILLRRTNLAQTQLLVERIQKAVEAEKDESIHLSISLGCAEKTPFVPDMEDVLSRAENNMYREKLVESKLTKIQIVDSIKKQLFLTMEEENENYAAIGETCGNIGKIMGLGAHDLNDLTTAALLHDIGKVTINRELLNKQTTLTEEDWTKIRRHSEAGYHILKSLSDMSQAAEYVLAHHERWDGEGYPKGLKQQEIPLQSRIISVVDSYFAMISDRPYRKAFTRESALDEIRNRAGTQFDPVVVNIFLSNCPA